jgi:hypothetical protein
MKLTDLQARFLKPPEPKAHVYDPSVRDLRNPFDWFCPYCEKVAVELLPITLGEVFYCRCCGGKLYVDNEGFTKARADDVSLPPACTCREDEMSRILEPGCPKHDPEHKAAPRRETKCICDPLSGGYHIGCPVHDDLRSRL